MPILPRIVTKNWQLKLAAVALAVMLWTVPRFDTQSRQVLSDVPVRVQLNDPQYAVRGDPFPETIDVTLSGSARALFGLGVDRPSVVVPVDRVVSTDTAVLLRFQWLRIPEGEDVVVEEFRPSSVRLSFEPREFAALGVSPRFTGSLPEDLALVAPPRVTPDLVRISGPASRLEEMDSLSLVPLDLSEVTGSGTFARPVDTTGLGAVVIAPEEAAVELTVEEVLERTIRGVKIRLPDLPADPQLQARPPEVDVILSGGRSLVQQMDSAALVVTLPQSGVRTLAPGEELRTELVVEGLPPYVEARTDPALVVLRRPAGR